MNAEPTSTYFNAPDGLRLHVREYGPRNNPRSAVVYLPGLTRTVDDFDIPARALAAKGRRVLALDSRGRGLSAYDREPANYSLPVELGDVIAMLTAREAQPAVFVGSSRGGLLTMLLAAVQPASIAGAVLNDIGPVIEPKGLMRIKGYVGKTPQPRNEAEGADILRRMFSGQFPALTADDWIGWARRSWREEGGRFAPTSDPQIAKGLENFAPEVPIPPMWLQFDALASVPVMVVRGANSDLLMPETVAAMKARRPDLATLEIADQGHTPLLAEPDTIARLSAFIDTCDPRH
jgi:pimeloyl-ACP methyl ester carboxylesterase